MPNLHFRALAREAGKRVEHALRPLLASEDELPARALLVPSVARLSREGEAAECNSRVDDPGLEDVRVCTGEHAGHHRARRGADGEDTVGVDPPIGDGEPCGGGNPDGVAAPVVLQRSI